MSNEPNPYGVMDEEDVLNNLEDPFASEKTDEKEDGGVFATGATPPEQQVLDIQETPASKPKAKKSSSALVPKKRARKPLTPREKILRGAMRTAGVEKAPELEHLMRGKGGTKMRICDIGLFIGSQDNEVLSKIAESCPVPNRVNLSAAVQVNQVKKVGSDILSAGRMYQPIQVARIEDDGALECTSGRHRMAFLALLYGPRAEIPVYVEDMTLTEARDAVVVANQARPTKALERAEHAVLKAVHGDIDAGQDEMYTKTATKKTGVRKYCIYSVMERKYPVGLDFKVSLTASRKDGALTTVTNVENFWSTALFEWHKDMSRKDFDAKLKSSTEFLNALVKAMEADPGFEPKQHLASMTLSAIGMEYRAQQQVTRNAIEKAEQIAHIIVGMGECGRKKSYETWETLSEELSRA